MQSRSLCGFAQSTLCPVSHYCVNSRRIKDVNILISVPPSLCLSVSLTETNVCSVVSMGYISSLLRLYEDWHSKDTQHVAIAIRYALLCCLHKVTHITAGRKAFISQGGIRLLYQTTQVKFKSSLQFSFCLFAFCLDIL